MSTIHCWASQEDEYEFGTDEWAEAFNRGFGICMLPDGHDGPHVFTPPEDIAISFAPSEEEL